jgi:hypothetical protein
VFDPAGLDPAALTARPTRLSLSGLDPEPASAAVSAVLGGCYRIRLREETDRLPWLLVDEAHAFVDSVADPALRRVLTRGRAPGTSLVLATQRPSALPEVAASQADLLIAHRLTGRADREALELARPAVARLEAEREPAKPGEAVVFDDAGGSVHAVRIRERETPHGGSAPRVSERFSPQVDHPSAPDGGDPGATASGNPASREPSAGREPTATGTGGESDGT